MTQKKKSPFTVVSEQLSFYPDLSKDEGKHEIFIGMYASETNLGDDPDPTKQIPVYIFDEYGTGERKYIIQSYAIKKAVQQAKKVIGNLTDVIFKFEYIGKTLVNGKPFNQFDTGFCTLDVYEASLLESEPETKKPKK